MGWKCTLEAKEVYGAGWFLIVYINDGKDVSVWCSGGGFGANCAGRHVRSG